MIAGLEIPPSIGWPILGTIALAVVGYIIQRALKNRPGAPTVTEAWEETRKVRNEMDDLRAAFEVLIRHLERSARDWNKGKPFPRFTTEEKAILEKVRPLPEASDQPPDSG